MSEVNVKFPEVNAMGTRPVEETAQHGMDDKTSVLGNRVAAGIKATGRFGGSGRENSAQLKPGVGRWAGSRKVSGSRK